MQQRGTGAGAARAAPLGLTGFAILAGLCSPVSAGEAEDGAAPAWLLFSGGDVASETAFFYAGARRSLNGHIDAAGWLLSAFSGAGYYRYDTQNVPGGRVEAQFTVSEASLGYQWRAPAYGLATFAGLRVEHHEQQPRDPGNPVDGTEAGLALMLDGWTKPVPDVLVTLFASATTVHDGYYARLTAGYRLGLGEDFYLGAEAALLGNTEYRQLRVGLHATGLRLGAISLGLSGGLLDDRDNGTGAYGALNAWSRL